MIQMGSVPVVLPNSETDPDFRDALIDAVRAGVHVIFAMCDVTENEINIREARMISNL